MSDEGYTWQVVFTFGAPRGRALSIRYEKGRGIPRNPAPFACMKLLGSLVYSSYFANTMLVLCPPKPNAFDMVTLTSRSTGVLNV